MNAQTARNQFANRQPVLAALLCAVAGGLVFQFAGNATLGYIHTRSLFYWWSIQWFDPAAETQHGMLILLVALWLLWRNLRVQGSPAAAAESFGRAPLVAMLLGLALHLAGYAVQQTRVSIVALLVFTWGVLALAGGKRWGKAAVFPLVFVLLAVPVSFVDTLGFNLRLAVAQHSFILAQKLGVALVRNGTQLLSADGRFQYDVAAACSGIRSLVALLALALLVGYLGLRSWFARLALAAACLPYVVVGNIVRVLVIVFAAEKFGPETGSKVHETSGVIVFLVVLGLLLLTLALLRRVGFAGTEKPANNETAMDVAVSEPSAPGQVSSPWRVFFTAAVAASLVFGATAWLGRQQQRLYAGIRLAPDGESPVELPAFIGTDWVGRRIEVSPIEREVLPADTGYSRKNYVCVADIGRQVFMSVVLSGRDRTSIHRPELCLVGQGWTISGRSKYEFSAGGATVPTTLLRIEHAARDAKGAPVQVQSLFAYWFVGGETLEATHFGMQCRDLFDRVRHLRADRWAYIVVQTVITNGDEAAALARMQEIVVNVWPEIRAEPVDTK